MFRLTNSLRNLVLTTPAFTQTNTNLQAIRWRRKPRWVPTAKSKIYRVSVRPVIPIEEQEELKRLYNNYRTQIKSIRRYLTYKHATRLQQTVDTQQHIKEFEEDFARCNELNEQWNAELKIVREERYQKELDTDIEIAKNRIEERKRINALKLEEVEELVREQKQAAGSFITRENLNEAIERAIANPVDYNFAIDLEGNRIEGRETVLEEEKISIKQ